MLRIIQNSTPAGAKSYYSTADYYSEGQELEGVWRGDAAARLGLAGAIDKEDWDALCDNRDPRSGETLTVRQKENRRVGYDINFHVPKSVSVMYALSEDPRILDAFRQAVDETMRQIETETQARVRSGSRNEDRVTGNMVWGDFVHTTARPVDGVPDPHLHAHCFVFNTTWDDAEGRWKAAQFGGIKRDAPYFEAMFHSRLARGLAELGLPIERTAKGWELADVPEGLVAKFSRRTREVEDAARASGVTDPERKGELGARTRSRKQGELTAAQLLEVWSARLSDDERSALTTLAERVGDGPVEESPGHARRAFSQALSHCLERRSVVPERLLLAEALKRSYGAASHERVVEAAEQQPLVRGVRDGRSLVSTPEVLEEERVMLRAAREGRGACEPLAPGMHEFQREWLGADQRQATQRILASRDRITMLRGGAGTGKTAMALEAVGAMQRAGRAVHLFAPSAQASRGVLRAEGFTEADTVARLLVDSKLQDRVRGGVIWIDEAGLLGSRTMQQVVGLTDRLDARLILSGDRRQHGSVERGSVLALLEEEAGLVPAELREIRRQAGDYRRAVRALSEGRSADGIDELDRLGWIREAVGSDRHRLLAEDYLSTVAAGESALVVTPTHREGEAITQEIRAALRARGGLSDERHEVLSLSNRNLTEAERADPVNTRPGDVLVYHQNAPGRSRGSRWVVDGEQVPAEQASRFQVFQPSALELSPGELVRITRNGTTTDGKHRLNNGAVYRLDHIDADGDLVLNNGWTIDRDFGHIAHGYVSTSHASQGRTVDRVFVAMGPESAGAGSKAQLYVSASRGRKQAVFYAEDREALLEAARRSEDELTATSLAKVRGRARHLRELPERARMQEKEIERG